MVSSRTRVLLRMIDKGTNASMDDYKRLFVMNINDFENEMKNSKYGDIDRMHYIMQTDPSKMVFIRKVELELYEYKHKFQELAHDLIKLRNKIFNTQMEWKKIDNPKKAGLEPRNVAKFLEYSKSLEDKDDYSIYKLFKIGRKIPASKKVYYDSTEMTDMYRKEEIELTDSDMEGDSKLYNTDIVSN